MFVPPCKKRMLSFFPSIDCASGGQTSRTAREAQLAAPHQAPGDVGRLRFCSNAQRRTGPPMSALGQKQRIFQPTFTISV
jgi:hypothetical protein